MRIGKNCRRMIASLAGFILLASMFAVPASGAEAGRHASVKGIIKYTGEFIETPATVWDIFDPWYYLTANAGPQASAVEAGLLTGEDVESLYREFMDEGLAAGKSCSPYLNLAAYRRVWPDLDARFGDDWDSYVAFYFTEGIREGQNDGTNARDAYIREVLATLAAQNLRGAAFAARLLELYPAYNIVPPTARKASSSSKTSVEESETREWAFPPEKPDIDPDAPHAVINRLAREHMEGYQLHADPGGTGDIAIDNKTFKGTFHADTYRDIIANPALKGSQREYTVMLYLCGTDLEAYIHAGTNALIDLLKGQYDLDRVNVLVMAGGTLTWQNDRMKGINDGANCCLYYLDPHGVRDVGKASKDFWTFENQSRILTADAPDGSSTGSMRLLADFGQVSMGDSELLLGFLDTAYELFPAEHYWLSLWNHGNGAAAGVCGSPGITATENAEYYRGVDIPYKALTLGRIEEALNSSRIYRERGGLDIVSMDACMMGGIETAYNLWPYADYLTASEETTYDDVAYDVYLKDFREGAGAAPSSRELAMNAAQSYIADHGGQESNPATNACYDLKALRDYGTRMERFGAAMSALLADETTAQDAFYAVYGAASRAMTFNRLPHLNAPNGDNLVDLYGFLTNLYGNLGIRAQSAYEAGNLSVADRYIAAMKAIDPLCAPEFILYRGLRYRDAYGSEMIAGDGRAMSIEMTDEDYLNLWKAAGLSHLCGVQIYLPYKYPNHKDTLQETDNYFREAIFPAYADFTQKFGEMMRSEWFQKAFESGKEAMSENPGRLFSAIYATRYDWKDDEGKDHSETLINVRFNRDFEPDAAAVLLFNANKVSVDVMRHGKGRSRETGEEQPLDIIISRSSAQHPNSLISGRVTTDVNGEVTDTTGITLKTRDLSFIAYYITGATADTDEDTRAMDWATESMDDISQFVEQTGREEDSFIAMRGLIHYDVDGDLQTSDASLIFCQNQSGAYDYVGASVRVPAEKVNDGKEEPEDRYATHTSDVRSIEFYHYTVADGSVIRVEDFYEMDKPVFLIDEEKPLPVIRQVDPVKIDPDNAYETDFNKFGVDLDNIPEKAYKVDGDGEDAGCVNPEKYEEYVGIGAIVSADEPADAHGPDPLSLKNEEEPALTEDENEAEHSQEADPAPALQQVNPDKTEPDNASEADFNQSGAVLSQVPEEANGVEGEEKDAYCQNSEMNEERADIGATVSTGKHNPDPASSKSEKEPAVIEDSEIV